MALDALVGAVGGERVRSTPKSVIVTRVAEGIYHITRTTRVELSSSFVGWRQELLGCVYRPKDSTRWYPNVPVWREQDYVWKALDTPGYTDSNEAICVLLDKVGGGK